MSKHTPGPWSVVAGDNYMIECDGIPEKYPHRFPGDDLGRFVAFVGNRQSDFGEADACLIAAAPDLLAALKALCDMHDDDLPFAHAEWRAAREAIASAEQCDSSVDASPPKR